MSATIEKIKLGVPLPMTIKVVPKLRGSVGQDFGQGTAQGQRGWLSSAPGRLGPPARRLEGWGLQPSEGWFTRASGGQCWLLSGASPDGPSLRRRVPRENV